MILKKFISLKRRIVNYRKNTILNDYYYNLPIDKNLILLESKNGGDIAGNIFYIIKELNKNEYGDYKIVISLKKELHDIKKNLLHNYDIFDFIFTETGSLEYYKYLYSAKYLFSDSTFPSVFIKKPEQIYLNTWHGTPLKKLGKTNEKRCYGLGNVQRNFAMADYLLYPNPFMEETMINSFMLKNLSKAKIMNEGYPRNTIFFNKDAASELKSQLGINDKQVIVYMPTWRGLYTNLDIKGQNKTINKYLSEIDALLSNKQVLFVKLHTVVKDELNYKEYKHIKAFPQEYETYHILNMADCLITDYSSVLFDFACSKKKIILFVYDEDEYLKETGTYFSLDELPFPKVYSATELVKEINKPKKYHDKEFLEKFCKYENSNATETICKYLFFDQDNNVQIKDVGSDGKENILIYIGSLSDDQITESLVTLLENINLKKRNYYLTFRASQVKNNVSKLFELSKKLNYIPMHDNLTLNLKDLMAFRLFFKHNKLNNMIKKQLDLCYKRNLVKYFPTIKFDKIIHFTGFDKQIINLLEREDGEKTIFVHKNILKEIEKGKQHEITLKQAYNNYDHIFITKKELFKPTLELSSKSDNIIVCEDFNLEDCIEKFESL
ncbi:MAG: hypothetical protein Kow0019_19450 [Methanobacteriaceae archaeon]